MYPQPVISSSSPSFFNDTLSQSVLRPPPPFTIASDIQALTRQAFAAVNGFQPETPQQLSRQHITVFNAVAKALGRAMQFPEFSTLSGEQQRDAAVRLVVQCQQGLAMANAIQQALDNPATMAHQLMANAAVNHELNGNVFGHIALAYLPTTQLASPAVSAEYMGRIQSNGMAVGH